MTDFFAEEKSEVLIPSFSGFTMAISESMVRKIDAATVLRIEGVIFMQKEKSVFYFGQLGLNSFNA